MVYSIGSTWGSPMITDNEVANCAIALIGGAACGFLLAKFEMISLQYKHNIYASAERRCNAFSVAIPISMISCLLAVNCPYGVLGTIPTVYGGVFFTRLSVRCIVLDRAEARRRADDAV
jgi:hypothetical protein